MDQSAAQLIRCTVCGATNRVPLDKLAQRLEAVCGRSKSPLPIGNPVTVTDATFAAEVEGSALPVLVDMWAEWCGPCRMIGPLVDELAVEMAGRLRVAKLNVDENPITAARFNIRNIPALVVIKNGHEVDRLIGVLPKAEIARRLQLFLG
jgi:thioredoxin 2